MCSCVRERVYKCVSVCTYRCAADSLCLPVRRCMCIVCVVCAGLEGGFVLSIRLLKHLQRSEIGEQEGRVRREGEEGGRGGRREEEREDREGIIERQRRR